MTEFKSARHLRDCYFDEETFPYYELLKGKTLLLFIHYAVVALFYLTFSYTIVTVTLCQCPEDNEAI